MTEHVLDLIDPYLDGEVEPKEIGQIEAHLIRCEECAGVLAQRRRLSNLLKSQPAAPEHKTDKLFASEVMGRVSFQPQVASTKFSIKDLGWIGIPIMLVIGLAFIQTTWIESSLMQFVPQMNEGLDPGQFLLPFSFALPASLIQFVNFLLGLNFWSWHLASTVLLSAALSFGYIAWLAGWWLKDQNREASLKSEMEI